MTSFSGLPAGAGHADINALTAADRVVIVTTAALWSSEGIARLLTTMNAIREYSNPKLALTGVIVQRC